MASAIASRECSKCKNVVGSFTCEGCKSIFCLKHSIEHRQELCARFEELMTEHNILLQQMQDKGQQKELLKKDYYARIDEWKNIMLEKVHRRAEEIRQELDELVEKRNQMMLNNIQSAIEEIQRRHEREDFFEHDIERMERNMKEAQQSIDKSLQPASIELCIESNETIDWENLIHLKEQYHSASSSVENKQNIEKEQQRTRNTTNSYPIENPIPYAPVYFGPNTPYRMNVASTNATHPQTPQPSNTGFYSGFSIPNIILPTSQRASNTNDSSNPPSAQWKREKKPLLIVDPKSHSSVELPTSQTLADAIGNSSQATPMYDTASSSLSNIPSGINWSEAYEQFHQQCARLPIDNPNI